MRTRKAWQCVYFLVIIFLGDVPKGAAPFAKRGKYFIFLDRILFQHSLQQNFPQFIERFHQHRFVR
jgi:hypothetical protein